jgi:hypothetical protein
VAALLTTALPAEGKEGVEATLTTAFPLDAPAGSTLTVGWTLTHPDEQGGRQPFDAGEVFVRLRGTADDAVETGWAAGQAGNYVATVRVPRGGIGAVEIGLRGYVNGTTPSDAAFPITNDPLSGGSRPSSSPRTGAPETSEIRGCGSRGETNRPQRLPGTPGERIGPLVIWPTVRTGVVRTPGNAAWLWYVKAPIVVPARVRAVLAVAPEAAGLAAMQGRNGTWVSSVRFEACRESTPAWVYDGTVGRYTGFPFAFALSGRGCVPLELWIEGRATPIRRLVPFGRRSC